MVKKIIMQMSSCLGLQTAHAEAISSYVRASAHSLARKLQKKEAFQPLVSKMSHVLRAIYNQKQSTSIKGGILTGNI